MSTGFGYVRDSKPNIIDWADIGKKMSDSLELEIKDRQKRKDDINAKAGEFSSQLLDQPQGAYAEANRFFADFSQQASQQALRDLQDLKSGRLSEQEYYQRRANLQSGTDLMFKAGKLFNDNYSQAMQRIQDGSASVLEADLKAKMEGYLNFAKSGAYINPLTGTVNVSILDNNGNVSSKRGDFMDASELVKLSSEKFDNFKLDETIKNITDRLGNITYRTPDGKTIKVSTIDFDLLDKKDQAKFKNKFNNAIDSEVDAIVGGINSKAAASILADHSGESYSLAFDINNTDENKIIFDPNGNVQLTESQLNKAKEIVRNKLRSQIDATILEKPALSEKQKLELDILRKKLTDGDKDKPSEYVSLESIFNETRDPKDTNKFKQSLEVIKQIDDEALNSDNARETLTTIKRIFDFNPAFSNVKLEDVQVKLEPPKTEEQRRRLLTSNTELKTVTNITDPSIEFFIPEIMEKPVYIPLSTNQRILQDFLIKLDKLNRQNQINNTNIKAKVEDFADVFPDKSIFNLYNSGQASNASQYN